MFFNDAFVFQKNTGDTFQTEALTTGLLSCLTSANTASSLVPRSTVLEPALVQQRDISGDWPEGGLETTRTRRQGKFTHDI